MLSNWTGLTVCHFVKNLEWLVTDPRVQPCVVPMVYEAQLTQKKCVTSILQGNLLYSTHIFYT